MLDELSNKIIEEEREETIEKSGGQEEIQMRKRRFFTKWGQRYRRNKGISQTLFQ